MKKMVRNSKGFSLIELIIAVAILAILAAVSINVFGDVLGKSRDKGEKGGESALETAITSYVSETGDKALSKLNLSLGTSTVANVVTALSKTYKFDLDNTGEQEYGPWINASDVKSPKTGRVYTISYDVNTGRVDAVAEASGNGAGVIKAFAP